MTIEAKLLQLKKEKHIGIMTHVVIGYPSLDKTISIVKTMANHGVDFVELQIPFSDPLADGPTIMKACEQSIATGTQVKDSFEVMKQLSSQVSIPLVLMGYYNTVFKYGVHAFCRDAKSVGVSGLIVPDIPPDEENRERYYFFCRKYGLHNIQVVSPVSTPDRLKINAQIASGLVYCIAHQGTTGAKDNLDPKLISYLKKVRHYFSLPLAVGFGISKREHLELLKEQADIAIIGSAIIDIISKSSDDSVEKEIGNFLDSLLSKKP